MGRQDLLISRPPLAAALRRNLKHSAGIKSERTFCQIRLYPIYFPRGGGGGGGGGGPAHSALEQASGFTSACFLSFFSHFKSPSAALAGFNLDLITTTRRAL